MSFDRAVISRLIEGLASQPGVFDKHIKHVLQACLAEIDRQAAIMCAAIDDAPGYPCGCSHELDADGVITTTHTRCEAHRRAEAQVRRVREDMTTLGVLYNTDGVAQQHGHQIEKILDRWDNSILAETEGP